MRFDGVSIFFVTRGPVLEDIIVGSLKSSLMANLRVARVDGPKYSLDMEKTAGDEDHLYVVPATNLVFTPEPSVLTHSSTTTLSGENRFSRNIPHASYLINDYDLPLATNDYETVSSSRQTPSTVCSIAKLRADEILSIQTRLRCSRVTPIFYYTPRFFSTALGPAQIKITRSMITKEVI